MIETDVAVEVGAVLRPVGSNSMPRRISTQKGAHTRTVDPLVVRVLDFLSLDIHADGAVRREGDEFVVERPWAIGRFGRFVLKTGWWMLEASGGEEQRRVELRLSSASNPLIAIPGGNVHEAKAVRLYLQAPEEFDVSMLLSPWPGHFKFKRLRFRQMESAEVLNLIGNSAARLVRSNRPLDKVAHVTSQLIGRRPIGFRTSSTDASASAGPEPVRFNAEDRALQPRMVRYGGIDALLAVDDTLQPGALELVAHEFQRSPQIRAVYSDALEGGVIVPRPNWSADLAPWFEIAGPPVFFKAGLAFDNSDPLKWLNETVAAHGSESIMRLPLPLVRRAKGHWPVLPPIPLPKLTRRPVVSVIIPTKYRIDLLEKCLTGLIHQTAYPNLEVVVVDNGSTDPRLSGVLKKAAAALPLTYVVDDAKFNFSRLVNLGAAHSSGEIILLLNDDIQPIKPGWLDRMVDSVLTPGVGAVGARLLYPDKSIQHAGVAMGIGGVCGHLWRGLSESDAARCPYVVYASERMAVTGACLGVRREVFDKVAGLDEVFPVSLNDIDFCLRIRAAGYRNILRGDAVLIHYESQSRGADTANGRTRRRLAGETAVFQARWRSRLEDDVFSSPEFDPRTESGAAHYEALGV